MAGSRLKEGAGLLDGWVLERGSSGRMPDSQSSEPGLLDGHFRSLHWLDSH